MAFQLIWSPSAQLDINDIVVFIGEDSSTDAKRFVLRLFKAAERLADCPDPAKFAPAVTMTVPLFVQGIKHGVPGIGIPGIHGTPPVIWDLTNEANFGFLCEETYVLFDC